jgi:hypothetical protein
VKFSLDGYRSVCSIVWLGSDVYWFSVGMIHPLRKVGWSNPYYCKVLPFTSNNICLIYLGSLMVCAHMFTIVISCCWIDSFINMQWPSLSLYLIFFNLKYALFGTSITGPLPLGFHLYNRSFSKPSLSIYVYLYQ